MKIAIVGSRKSPESEWRGRGTREAFERACREIGALVAQGGHRLVVQSDKKKTADLYAVRGYLDALSKLEPTAARGITIVSAQSKGDNLFEREREKHPGVVSIDPGEAQKRGSVRSMEYPRCYATIVIGGGGGTERTASAVLAAGARLVPIASFGGAAAGVLAMTAKEPRLGASQVPIARAILQKDWSDPVRTALGDWLDSLSRGPALVVVHGRDHAARDSLVGVLQELGVGRALIMELEQLSGETLPEKWETVAAQAEGAIVLATPDDEGRARGEARLQPRARQNVWLELGWLWGRFLDRRRLLLLTRDADGQSIEIPSDYDGVVFEKFEQDPNDSRKAIAAFVDQLRRHLAE